MKCSKWSKFFHFSSSVPLLPKKHHCYIASLTLPLFRKGLATSSLKVHLAVVSIFHDLVDELKVFCHSTMQLFLKRLLNFNVPHEWLVPAWSLPLALTMIMPKPFEPLATNFSFSDYLY